MSGVRTLGALSEIELPQIQNRHLKDEAYEVIKDAITSLRLKPGAMIIEGELARRLGISKTPVRHALVRLEQNRLVYTVPFRGTFVSRVTLRDVEELFAVRASLEELAIRRAVADGPREEFALLHARNEAVAADFRRGALDESFEEIRRFHESLVALSRNARLGQMYDALAPHLTRIRNICGRMPGRVEQSVNQHREIVRAMEAGAADAAVEALRAHLSSLATADFEAAEDALAALLALEPLARSGAVAG